MASNTKEFFTALHGRCRNYGDHPQLVLGTSFQYKSLKYLKQPDLWFLTRYIGSYVIDVSYNRFSGPLPHLNSNALLLNLSNNLFQ
jgi:hypothetical protein